MQRRLKLLHSFVQAFSSLPAAYDQGQALQRSFDLVAARRPDLVSKGLFAERARSTAQLEKVLREALKELEAVAAETPNDELIYAPYLGHLRFNHSTGRLHLGHSRTWVYVFPDVKNSS